MKADYTLQAVKGIKKSFDNSAVANIMKYKDSRLFFFDETNEWSEIFTSTESMSGTKSLGELETPPTLKLNDGRSITLEDGRYGGGITVSETDKIKMKDDTTKIDKFLIRQRNNLLGDLQHTFLTDIFGMYNEAHLSTSDTLAPDGVEICGAHLDADDAAWFDNSATEAMDSAAIDTMNAYAGAFKDPSGKPMPLDFNTIVVKTGTAAANTAKKLFANSISPIVVGEVNIYEGEYTIIESPYITNALYWYAFDSRKELPLYVGITKMPSLNAPIVEKNESITTNATAYWKTGVINAPYNFYGSVGSA